MKTRFLAVAAAAAIATAVHAEEGLKLPPTIGMATFPAETGGFAQIVAIGLAVGEAYGSDIRVIPANTDPARLAPMIGGRIDFAVTGQDSIYAQEGVFTFADRSTWGPQKVAMVMMNVSDGGVGLAVAPEIGADRPRDLKGKRVAYISPSPAMIMVAQTYLAFDGLTWDDVIPVEYSGFSQALDGFVNGEVDATISASDSGSSARLQASPRGLDWIETPEADAENWARLSELYPWMTHKKVTFGNGVPEQGLDFVVARYPTIMTRLDNDEDFIYNFVRAMVAQFPQYKDSAPGADGWAIERQDLDYFLPWHPGAVKAWREFGLWNDELEAAQARKLQRQEVLAEAWAEIMSRDIEDDTDFVDAWMAARRDALEKAGFRSYF